MPISDCDARFQRVKAAFDADGFGIAPIEDPESPGGNVPYLERQGNIACAAKHRTARDPA